MIFDYRKASAPADIEADICIVGAGAAEQAAVHDRVQGLDPAIHHFREAGGFAHVLHRQAGVAQGPGGAAGGEQFHAMRGERAGEVDQAGLVGHGEQRARDLHGGPGQSVGGHAGERGKEARIIAMRAGVQPDALVGGPSGLTWHRHKMRRG